MFHGCTLVCRGYGVDIHWWMLLTFNLYMTKRLAFSERLVSNCWFLILYINTDDSLSSYSLPWMWKDFHQNKTGTYVGEVGISFCLRLYYKDIPVQWVLMNFLLLRFHGRPISGFLAVSCWRPGDYDSPLPPIRKLDAMDISSSALTWLRCLARISVLFAMHGGWWSASTIATAVSTNYLFCVVTACTIITLPLFWSVVYLRSYHLARIPTGYLS